MAMGLDASVMDAGPMDARILTDALAWDAARDTRGIDARAEVGDSALRSDTLADSRSDTGSSPGCVPGSITYTAVGIASFEVPPGCLRLTIKAWGGGGGGAGPGTSAGAGGGGFASATIDVLDGEILTILVGDGGGSGSGCTSAVGGGGVGNGCGGGRSAVGFEGIGLEFLTAGGGGGAGSANASSLGGGGGGNRGQDAPGDPGIAGEGGSAGAPGGGPCSPGGAFVGGNGCGASGGGGGGGWFGGGGAQGGFGGGGGSGNLAPEGVLIAAIGSTPPSQTDPDYRSGTGVGGVNFAGGFAGLVVLRWF